MDKQKIKTKIVDLNLSILVINIIQLTNINKKEEMLKLKQQNQTTFTMKLKNKIKERFSMEKHIGISKKKSEELC